MGARAAELRPVFARRLGLAEDAIPWHAARDRVVDLGHALSQLAGAADRIAQEVVRLQATEIAELSEPLTAGHVGSSTMPQKRNPMTSEYLAAGAMLLRATVSVLPAAAAHASERDMARWGVEWLAVPQAVVLAGGVADKLAHVLEGLVVDEARMRANLDATGGQIMAEAVMMRLAERIGHETAHHLVMAACRRAATGGSSLADELLADETLGLDRAQVEALLDPAGYLGLSGAFVDAVAGAKPA
jgi:adenylosuccinate lyase